MLSISNRLKCRIRAGGVFLLAVLALWSYEGIAASYAIKDDVVGEVTYYRTQTDDNLYALARHYDLGIVELFSANPGVDAWQPQTDTQLTIASMYVLPSGKREGIVINLAEMRLYFYHSDKTMLTFPVGIGREGWQTPTGQTRILRKRKHPVWTPPPSIRKESPHLPASFPPGPDNPLGDYALDLGLPGILIHGTNRPHGIGKRVSHGCMRLYPEDIEQLFALVEAGAPVTIIDAPYKLGWRGNMLFLEVSPTQQQADAIANYQLPGAKSQPEIYDLIQQAEKEGARIDWYAAEEAIIRQDGIPWVIGEKSLQENKNAASKN